MPPAPAGLYRITQGLHVATGIAVHPAAAGEALVGLPPPVRVAAVHATWPTPSSASRLVPLVGGSLFMLFSGTANIERWYPWQFFFPAGHYWAAWITIGALVVHIGAKLAGRAAGAPQPGRPGARRPRLGALARARFLGADRRRLGLLTLVTVGQTVGPLRPARLASRPADPTSGPRASR